MLTEDTTPQELHEMWIMYPHKLKMRKEIASHPNADQNVLIEASRLYIREVLSNPALEFIELFSSEEDSSWIRILKFAYSNPVIFLSGIQSLKGINSPNKARYYRFQNWNTKYWAVDIWKDYNLEKIPFAYFSGNGYCGCLLQAALYGAADKDQMNREFFSLFFSFVPNLTEFKRALKDAKVKEKIDEYLNKQKKEASDYENIYMMWIFGVIDDSALISRYIEIESFPAPEIRDTFLKSTYIDNIVNNKNFNKLKKIASKKEVITAAICIAYRTCQRDLIKIIEHFIYSFHIKIEYHRDILSRLLELNKNKKIYMTKSEVQIGIDRLIKKSYYNIDYTTENWLGEEDFDTYWEKVFDIINDYDFKKITYTWMGTAVLKFSKDPKVVSRLIQTSSAL